MLSDGRIEPQIRTGKRDTLSNQEAAKETDRKQPCQVTFVVGETTFNGTSMHFNERGMLVLCKDPAPLNAKGKLSIVFANLNNPIEVNGEVVWTNLHGVVDSLSPKGMGIKFVNIDREMERLFAEFAAQYDAIGSIYSCYYT